MTIVSGNLVLFSINKDSSFCHPHSPFEFMTIVSGNLVLFSISKDSATYLWRLYLCVPNINVVISGVISQCTLYICLAIAFFMSFLLTADICSPNRLWRLQPVVPVYCSIANITLYFVNTSTSCTVSITVCTTFGWKWTNII